MRAVRRKVVPKGAFEELESAATGEHHDFDTLPLVALSDQPKAAAEPEEPAVGEDVMPLDMELALEDEAPAAPAAAAETSTSPVPYAQEEVIDIDDLNQVAGQAAVQLVPLSNLAVARQLIMLGEEEQQAVLGFFQAQRREEIQTLLDQAPDSLAVAGDGGYGGFAGDAMPVSHAYFEGTLAPFERPTDGDGSVRKKRRTQFVADELPEIPKETYRGYMNDRDKITRKGDLDYHLMLPHYSPHLPNFTTTFTDMCKTLCEGILWGSEVAEKRRRLTKDAEPDRVFEAAGVFTGAGGAGGAGPSQPAAMPEEVSILTEEQRNNLSLYVKQKTADKPNSLAPLLGPVLSPDKAGLSSNPCYLLKQPRSRGPGLRALPRGQVIRMDLLAQYSDSEGEEAIAKAKAAGVLPTGAAPKAVSRKPIAGVDLALLPSVDAAPDVDTLALGAVTEWAYNTADKRILTNPTITALSKPLQGPLEEGRCSLEQDFNNHKMGRVEKAAMSKFAFDQQYLTFHNFGYAANPCKNIPEGEAMVVSTEADFQEGRGIWDKPRKRQRLEGPDMPDDDRPGKGHAESAKWGGFIDSDVVRKQLEVEVKAREEEVARRAEEERAVEGEERETKERITSVFHGNKEKDYAGRSWIENKTNITKDVDDKQCFLPKKWVHTWTGHTMGVQKIRWFPKTAHLLLSAGMDAKIMIWDYHNQRKCLRSYLGHDQAVRDIAFTADGRRFYSVSYDKNIQYWDTETGQIISTFTNKKTPFCVSVHPDPSQQNVIVTGCSNKKAVQWDSNTCTIVQEYDEHMGAVNTATICEDGKRLLTSSDDKKMFLWEFGIPVVVKHIAEPTMHSIPQIVLSPDEKYLIGQSMDNKIIAYEAFGRFKFIARKTFKGHLNSGYAITPGWSADGKWVMSGDADGKLWFWDWGKCKNYRVLKAHDGVCTGCLWYRSQTGNQDDEDQSGNPTARIGYSGRTEKMHRFLAREFRDAGKPDLSYEVLKTNGVINVEQDDPLSDIKIAKAAQWAK
ncbi:Cdc40 [Symbiodinium microadriaticum]|nr:Cdc40 [Symbiodinium microadriaticum]